MRFPSLTICIPTRCVWSAICLTIESIRLRTWYPDYRILVVDNSLAPNARACEYHPDIPKMEDDGNRREYLKELVELKDIILIENTNQDRKYGHGENIKVLLKYCQTELALLFVSSAEILNPQWLTVLIERLQSNEKAIAVAREKLANNHFDQQWIAPTYWPNVMLLDMEKYRTFGDVDTDWDLKRILLPDFPYGELFDDLPQLKNPDNDPPRVFCDTGYGFWERIHYNNLKSYVVLPEVNMYWWGHYPMIRFFSGIDRNSHRPNHPHVVKQLSLINERLRRLRMFGP